MIKNIEVCKQMKKSNSGNNFPVYSAKMVDGKWIQMKFTKECCNNAIAKGHKIPDSDNDRNRFIVTVDTTNMNKSKNGLYDVVWVKEIDSITDIPTVNNCDELF